MGFGPSEVDKMSLWEFAACQDGWMRANSAEQEPDAPSYEEHLAMVKAASERETPR